MSLLRLPRAAPALRRSYATAANVSEAAGVKVLGIDNGLRPATSSVSVIVRAGSRYETAPGVAHVLKNFAFKVRRHEPEWALVCAHSCAFARARRGRRIGEIETPELLSGRIGAERGVYRNTTGLG